MTIWARMYDIQVGTGGFNMTLPFTSATYGRAEGSVMAHSIDVDGPTYNLVSYVSDNATIMSLYQSRDASSWASLDSADIPNNADCMVTLSYRTDS